jgi:hypothetical protein
MGWQDLAMALQAIAPWVEFPAVAGAAVAVVMRRGRLALVLVLIALLAWMTTIAADAIWMLGGAAVD